MTRKETIEGIKIASVTIIGFGLVAFMGFGGVPWLSSQLTTEQLMNLAASLFGLLVITGFTFLTISVIKSIKYYKKCKLWRNTIKVGEIADFSTNNGYEKVEIESISGDEVVIKLKVNKKRLVVPYEK